jgi:hypothetical protein
LADSGISTALLKELARRCTENDPQSAPCHELLGAALLRNGQPAEALRELEVPVQMQGKGGSLWAKLFLALTHQRLDHPGEATAWRDKALKANGWEEAFLQRRLLSELGNVTGQGR